MNKKELRLRAVDGSREGWYFTFKEGAKVRLYLSAACIKMIH